MIKRMSLPRMLLLLLTLCSSTLLAKSASVLLREGLYAEEVEGDLSAAIEIYQQVIEDSSAQDNLVAQALYRQGMCYMKLKKEQEAKAAFNRLVAEHSDQTRLIEKVKPLLDELGNADPASLMPPETVMYVEIGSPGKQIETILNMLKGTPFENPLAMIGGDNQPSGESMGPANMIGALLNPSMMAEFKKIRGLGIGITEIAQDNPPAIAVLYPGQSDALRGLLLAGLGMIGQAADPIEGMQVVHFPDGGGAAYDDTVVILASPSPKAIQQLTWSVKQYKGLIGQPSLASSNKSFAKISKRARQDNALTLWLNVNETYQGLMNILPPEAIPQQIHMANGLVDFKNVDDIIASLSINETGFALEANANLKEGHNCVAYNMIRTPHLSKAALRAIPSDAIALVSLALGEPGTPQAEAVSEQILNATSLDIGADLFSNFEQITLFAVPTTGSMLIPNQEIPPQTKAFGLSITSTNPLKTRELLTTVLRSANMMLSETEPVDGRYQITLANQQDIYGYMDQTSKTTVISLNPDIIATSVATMKQNAARAGDGTLKSAASALPETTSKLVMISLAGAIQFGLQNTDLPDDALGDQIRQAMTRLAQASEKTTIRLQTSEEDNNFGIRLSVNDLPPVGQIFGSIMQIQQAMSQIEARAMSADEQAPAAGIVEAKTAPAIDGKADRCWANAPQYDLKNSYYGTPSSEADLSASFKALYDRENLYVLVDVADDDLRNDSDEFWLDDGIELFIDADHSRGQGYDDNDYQFYFGWDATAPTIGEEHHGNTDGVEVAFAETEGGYRAEIKLPWSTLGTKPVPGTPIGFDVQVNDDDNGGQRDSKIAWHAPEDNAYLHPRVFGTAQPLGLVGWWKLDGNAEDSSASANHGVEKGDPSYVAGKFGRAVSFDGDGDRIEIPATVADNPELYPAQAVSASAWVKTTMSADDTHHSVIRHEFHFTPLQTHPRGGWVATFTDENGTRAVHTKHFDWSKLNDGRWHHYVATYNNGVSEVWIDGTKEASDTRGTFPLWTRDNQPWVFGGKEGGEEGGEYYTGQLDDVRLYNYPLGQDEIEALYTEGK